MRVFRRGMKATLWLATLAGAALIARGATVYFGDELPPFLLEKLPLPHADLWLFAVQVHVVATAFALPACLLLVWPVMLRRLPRVHRWLGRTTATALLLAAVPSGLYLSLFAKGGWPTSLGFVASGVIVAVSMVSAVRSARAGQVLDHRRSSMHVLGQLGVAVASRALLVLCDSFDLDADRAYLFALWGPVLVSLLAVELLFPRRSLQPRSSRVSPALAPVLYRRDPGLGS